MIEMRWVLRVLPTTIMGADAGNVPTRILQFREGNYDHLPMGVEDGFHMVSAETYWTGSAWKDVLEGTEESAAHCDGKL